MLPLEVNVGRPVVDWCILSLAVVLSGCGRSYCERNAAAFKACGLDVDEARLESCREDLGSCSKADEDLIDAWYECTEAAGAYACDASSAALTDALACSEHLDGLSDSCVIDEGIIEPMGS